MVNLTPALELDTAAGQPLPGDSQLAVTDVKFLGAVNSFQNGSNPM